MLNKFFFFWIFSNIFFLYPCEGKQKFNSGNDNPIEIFAEEGIEWHKNKKKYIAKGNAQAKKGDVIVKSDILEAKYEGSSDDDSEIKFLSAKGKVFIANANAKIEGGSIASYDIEKEYFLIKGTGNEIVLTSNRDKLYSNKKMEFWKNENIAIATGKARAHRGNEYKIFADRLIWHLIDTEKDNKNGNYEIKKMLAYDNVVIETNSELAYSDKALYNEITGICRLFGKVKLKKGDNYLTGEYAEMNLNTGISKLLPHPKIKNFKSENRVKALIKKNEK